MSSYYVVLQDMNYNNNHILFISTSEEAAKRYVLNHTNPKKDQISIAHYIMSDDIMISETEVPLNA